jgi:hypothetical protein
MPAATRVLKIMAMAELRRSARQTGDALRRQRDGGGRGAVLQVDLVA